MATGYAVVHDTATIAPAGSEGLGDVTVTVAAGASKDPIAGAVKFTAPGNHRKLVASYPSTTNWVFVFKRDATFSYAVDVYVSVLSQ